MPRDKPNSAGRNGARLTWAVGANGETTHISEAENGLRCACTCPTCGGALVAKQGKVVEHHFAHASGDECQHAVETALHLVAKDLLALRKEIVLPAVEIHSRYTSRRTAIAPERRYFIGSVAVERKLGSIIPDVIVQINGRELLVEVTVTHGVDRDKLRKIRDLGVSCVEIDLSDGDRGLSREEIETIVIDGITHKRWLYNVRAEEMGRKMLSEATLLPSVHRGLAWHVDECPIPARTWKQKPYANVIDDCSGCDYLLNASSDVGVICDGFRELGKLRPPQTLVRRPPPEAFEHPEEEDPMQAVGRWLDEQRHVSGSR
ncbi:MAG: hypothetical protein F4114_16150 [Rhodospirillaceae bacterium]|nr:hypothetical protein [Rhodospirillaceae bacterium]MYB13164.1 hypothetical protein [Rhodospirillaceae bacterium]MYI50603.1 hypothetical protein [Rhodospirillaceae bacterium]